MKHIDINNKNKTKIEIAKKYCDTLVENSFITCFDFTEINYKEYLKAIDIEKNSEELKKEYLNTLEENNKLKSTIDNLIDVINDINENITLLDDKISTIGIDIKKTKDAQQEFNNFFSMKKV